MYSLMRPWQVAANVKPSLVIFVMDGSIGQAAFDQAKAFKDAVEVRAWLAVPAACSHASSSHLLVVPRCLVPLAWLTKMAECTWQRCSLYAAIFGSGMACMNSVASAIHCPAGQAENSYQLWGAHAQLRGW